MADGRSITIEIKNLEDIKSAFRKSPVLMAGNLNKAIRKSLFIIQGDSMKNSPVRTGRLRASHTTLFSSLKGSLTPNVNYAFWVHDGTKYMHARPFLENSVKSNQSSVDINFEKAVRDTLYQIARESN